MLLLLLLLLLPLAIMYLCTNSNVTTQRISLRQLDLIGLAIYHYGLEYKFICQAANDSRKDITSMCAEKFWRNGQNYTGQPRRFDRRHYRRWSKLKGADLATFNDVCVDIDDEQAARLVVDFDAREYQVTEEFKESDHKDVYIVQIDNKSHHFQDTHIPRRKHTDAMQPKLMAEQKAQIAKENEDLEDLRKQMRERAKELTVAEREIT